VGSVEGCEQIIHVHGGDVRQDISVVTEPADAVETGAESRLEGRLPMRILVEYESMEDFLVDYTANVSIGGMFIQTTRPLEVGTRFRLRIAIPGRKQPIATTATVCWTLEGVKQGPLNAGMGIVFDALEGGDRRDVECLLASQHALAS